MVRDDRENPAGDWVRRLRVAGLRVTSGRLAVLHALAGAPGEHQDAEGVAAKARTHRGRLSTQAVYDNLRVLADAGLVRRIETAGSPSARYETRTGDNHHHLVCRRCGTTRDVDCIVGARPCLSPSHDHGFVLDEAEVTFWGVCPACRGEAARKGNE